MDFWGCDSKRYVHELLSEDDELDLGVHGGLDGSENMLFEFDFDKAFGFEEDALLLDKEVMERFQEVESGFSDVIQKLNETENSLNVEILGVGDGIFSGDDMNLASPDCGLSSFSLLGENENDEVSEKRLEDSVVDLFVTEKQANFECLSSAKVTCQVHGCNADLTFSKDYYKRHRVCPLDTKKVEVIVNGVKKRFCQQCSRFHLLNEFDEDKRSCRKRLAGHNKRRRKPRFENRLNRPHRFQPYQCQETRPQGAVLPPKTHLMTDLLPARVLFPDIYEQINGSRLQGGSVYGPTHMSNNIPTLRNPCPGPEYYTPQVRSSIVQKPSGVIDASYALSLLSNQPQFSPTYFSPVIIQGHNISSPHMFHTSGMNLIQAYQIHPSMLHGTMNPVNSMFTGGNHNGGTLCSNCCSNRHEHLQRGSTVDLRQLSFNLSRVEHQRSVP